MRDKEFSPPHYFFDIFLLILSLESVSLIGQIIRDNYNPSLIINYEKFVSTI